MTTRITIKADSVPTDELRAALVALNHAGHNGEMKVSLNGPECWAFETPPLNVAHALGILDEVGALSSQKAMDLLVKDVLP